MGLMKDVKIHGKRYLVLSENSLNTITEFNLYLKLPKSSVQTFLIREHRLRYHSRHDLMLSQNSFQILLNVITKFIQSAVRI